MSGADFIDLGADFIDLFIVLCLGLALGGGLSCVFGVARAWAMRRQPGGRSHHA